MNILSIDIDAFVPCHAYAKHMNFDVNAEIAWNIIDTIGIDYSVNKDALSKCMEILEKKCQHAKVRIIGEHDEIIGVMQEFKCKDSTVYNIDYHHDLGYGNDDLELNIENWVRFAKEYNLMKDYHWIHRPLSDIRYSSPFYHTRTCLDDLDLNNMNEIDLVVICISHHFTPKKYWDAIPNVLLSNIKGDLKHFQEVTPTTLSPNIFKGLNDYLIDGTMPEIYRLFRNGDCYLPIEKADEGVAISMISLSGKGNLFTIKEVVDKMIDEYNIVEFNYKVGIRNEIFIKRLVRYYDIISREKGYYKLKKKELI